MVLMRTTYVTPAARHAKWNPDSSANWAGWLRGAMKARVKAWEVRKGAVMSTCAQFGILLDI